MSTQTAIDWNPRETADHWPLRSGPESLNGIVFKHLADAGAEGRTTGEMSEFGHQHVFTSFMERVRELRGEGVSIPVLRRVKPKGDKTKGAYQSRLYLLGCFWPQVHLDADGLYYREVRPTLPNGMPDRDKPPVPAWWKVERQPEAQ